jgi:hypothetical protein
MPAFLKINGWEVPVAVDKGTAAPLELGTHDRSTDETLSIHRGADKLGVDFTTSWIPPETARALVALLRGRGDHWSFDPDDTDSQAYSGKGIELAGTHVDHGEFVNVFAGHTVGVPRFGSGCVEVSKATTNLFTSANVRTGTDTASDISDFTANGGATLTSSSSAAWQGSRSLKVASAASAGSGAQAAQACSASTAYCGSVYLKAFSGTPTVRVYLKETTGGSATGTAVSVTLSTSAWTRVSCTITTGAGVSALALVVDTPSSTAVTFYADGWQLQTGGFATGWVDGSRAASAFSAQLGDMRASDDLTIMFWTIGSATDGVAWLVGSSTDYLALKQSSAVVVGEVGRTGNVPITYFGGYSFDGDDWHHVAVVMRRQPQAGSYNLELYIDGAQYSPATATLPSLGANPLLYVGTDAGGANPWNGMFDDLVVLPYGLDADQIAGVYGLARSFPDLPKLAVSGLLVDAPAGLEIEMLGTKSPAVAITPATHPDQRTVAGSLEEQ